MAAPLPSQAAQQWLSRLTTISRNLSALNEADATKRIRARIKDLTTGFVGVTRQRATEAIALVDMLLDQYTLLAHVVDEAVALAAKNGAFRNYDGRINDLLNGPSVVLKQEQVALHERGLLDDEERVVRATPAEVLARMEESFVVARDALAAIGDAMITLRPRLAALRDEANRLNQWASTLGAANTTAPPDFSQALSVVESDPLGSVAEIQRIEADIARRRTELQAVDADRQATLTAIARGKAAMVELQDVLARADTAYAEVCKTLANAEPLAPPDGESIVASLNEWLSTLERNAATGRFAAVKVGMLKWEREYSERLSVTRASYAHNAALLNERADLRGRFTALSAKVAALRSRGVIVAATVENSARQTQGILDATPFDMRDARRFVEAFEAAISAASRSTQTTKEG